MFYLEIITYFREIVKGLAISALLFLLRGGIFTGKEIGYNTGNNSKHLLFETKSSIMERDDLKSCYVKAEKESDMNKNPVVTITMDDGSVIKAELYPETAPNTVNNFLFLAGKGFYDGLIFHRVIKGFMIQGGDPTGTGAGGPGYSIKGEFNSAGFKNDLKHTEGVLSMARSMDPNSAGSQFFIMHRAAPHLDGNYAAFGKVIEGMETVNKIASVATDLNDRPVNRQVIKKVTVETFGVIYPQPKKTAER